MIRHIVSWRLSATDAGERRAHADEIKARLEALRGIVPAERIEVGIDVGIDADAGGANWHVVLDSDFAGDAELAAYQTHPAHVEAAGFIRSVVAERSCVDYQS